MSGTAPLTELTLVDVGQNQHEVRYIEADTDPSDILELRPLHDLHVASRRKRPPR